MASQERNGFVVYSWTPEGRPVVTHEAANALSGAGRLRGRLAGRRGQIAAFLVLLAVAGFSIGYAVQVIPH